MCRPCSVFCQLTSTQQAHKLNLFKYDLVFDNVAYLKLMIKIIILANKNVIHTM